MKNVLPIRILPKNRLFFQNFPDLNTKKSFQNLPNISHHQLFFRIVIIGEKLFFQIFPTSSPGGSQNFHSFTRWQTKQPNVLELATIFGQIFPNRIPTIAVKHKFGKVKVRRHFDFILNKNALGAMVQSMDTMKLEEEDDFFSSWCSYPYVHYSPKIHPYFFLFLRSVFFSLIHPHAKNVAKVLRCRWLIPAWPRIIKRRWAPEHAGTDIFGQSCT